MFRCEDIVQNKESKLLTSQTTLIVDITISKTTLARAADQWEARSFPRLTHRGGVSAVVIQAIWANAMQSAKRMVIRDAAAVFLAYVLRLRESPAMSLPAEDSTHIAEKIAALVLVKGKAFRHAVPATYAQIGVANFPSPIDLLQKRTDLRPEQALLFGMPGDGNDWQPGSLSSTLQRSLHAVIFHR
jgi:hypothetical protein